MQQVLNNEAVHYTRHAALLFLLAKIGERQELRTRETHAGDADAAGVAVHRIDKDHQHAHDGARQADEEAEDAEPGLQVGAGRVSREGLLEDHLGGDARELCRCVACYGGREGLVGS